MRRMQLAVPAGAAISSRYCRAIQSVNLPPHKVVETGNIIRKGQSRILFVHAHPEPAFNGIADKSNIP